MRTDLNSVMFSYRMPNGDLAPVVASVSLVIEESECVCILGPSGCGKSTLLRLIAGLLTPDSGAITLDQKAPEVARSSRQIGMVFQDARLLPWLNVAENVAFGMPIIEGKRINSTSPAVFDSLIHVGMSEYATRLPSELSGGMEQRVAFARALIGGKRLLLLDEPFAHLDIVGRSALAESLHLVGSERDYSIICVTHDVEEAVFLADRVVIVTSRPSKIFKEVHIPFPRPRRRSELLLDRAFSVLVDQCRRLLMEACREGDPKQE